jgi:hypothetical protein
MDSENNITEPTILQEILKDNSIMKIYTKYKAAQYL